MLKKLSALFLSLCLLRLYGRLLPDHCTRQQQFVRTSQRILRSRARIHTRTYSRAHSGTHTRTHTYARTYSHSRARNDRGRI